jgi:hypothetical protein
LAVCDRASFSSTSRWLSASGIGAVGERIPHPTTNPTYLRDTTVDCAIVSFVVAPDAYDRFMGRYSIPLASVFADFAGVASRNDARSSRRAVRRGCDPDRGRVDGSSNRGTAASPHDRSTGRLCGSLLCGSLVGKPAPTRRETAIRDADDRQCEQGSDPATGRQRGRPAARLCGAGHPPPRPR